MKWPWLAGLFLLTACAGTAELRAVNDPGVTASEFDALSKRSENPELDESIVGLAFSGGGMRASAFSYGVLRTLSEMPLDREGKYKLTDSVDFVSGVSGGSVTAAYFALKGPRNFYDFREKFLAKNAEEKIITDISVSNLARVLTFGGVNDLSRFPVWLDANLFNGATYAEVLGKRPILWIGASDIFNRTPFIFSSVMFRPLCSDLSKLPISQAVAASAAVPGLFTPVNLQTFADKCAWEEPKWVGVGSGLYAQRVLLDGLRRYRDTHHLKYIKLLDGGLTDNFGVHGLAVMQAAQGTPYAPLNKDHALRLKRLLFLVVNSGRAPMLSEWNKQLESPDILTLATAVTDTAIDSNVHVTYDFFQLVMKKWQQNLVKWRCSLPKEEVEQSVGDIKNWKCDDLNFQISLVSFEDAGHERNTRLNNIPTSFVLPPEEVDFLVESADIAIKKNQQVREFIESSH